MTIGVPQVRGACNSRPGFEIGFPLTHHCRCMPGITNRFGSVRPFSVKGVKSGDVPMDCIEISFLPRWPDSSY
jgi:hypothetical protein